MKRAYLAPLAVIAVSVGVIIPLLTKQQKPEEKNSNFRAGKFIDTVFSQNSDTLLLYKKTDLNGEPMEKTYRAVTILHGASYEAQNFINQKDVPPSFKFNMRPRDRSKDEEEGSTPILMEPTPKRYHPQH